jgi:hypothetical protein
MTCKEERGKAGVVMMPRRGEAGVVMMPRRRNVKEHGCLVAMTEQDNKFSKVKLVKGV